MPTKPATFRPHHQRSKTERDRDHDARRSVTQEWRRWYKLPVWIATRRAQLQRCPLCARCESEGLVVAATVVHHVHAHKGDWDLFINGPFESLCAHHHNQEAQAEEARDRDGGGGVKSLPPRGFG